MPKDISKTRTALNDLIAQLASPDLGTEQGRLDYRLLLMAQNSADMLDLIDLPDLDADYAVVLYHSVSRRLRKLLDHQLLREDQAKDMIGELVALYARYRPELIPRVLTQPESTPDA